MENKNVELYSLELFAGAGGGILASQMLGHRTIGAIEIEAYPRKILLARQLDGSLPEFPIWDDITTFGANNPDTASYVERLRTIRHNLLLKGDFPAKISALPVKAQELQGNDPDYGGIWRGSLAKYDQNTRLWKIAQLSLLEDLEPCLVIWPRSGMTVNGQCWELPMLEPTINETGYGLKRSIWPTPNCVGYRSDGELTILARTLTDYDEFKQMSHRASQNKRKKHWPTPTAHNAKKTNSPSEAQRNTPTLAAQVGGHLNPTWTEWLMGWPLGWTDLKPLETDKCRYARQQHLTCL